MVAIGSLKQFLSGYLRLELSGDGSERFLNLCMKKEIGIQALSREKHGIHITMGVRDFRRIRPLVKKTHVHLKIIGRYGLPFFLYRNRKRKPYVIGCALFFLLVFLMSRFIWNIQIEGNISYTDDELLTYLSEQKVEYGMRKSKVNCDFLEEKIREDYPEITWVSAGISGTMLSIKIRENEVIQNVPEQEEVPCDLVADQTGTITRMIVRKGKAEVLPGDPIEKGQILVSGTVPILGDSQELLRNHYTEADADIYAKTEREFAEKLPKQTEVRVKTGRKRHGLGLKTGPIWFLWLLPGGNDRLWQITREQKQAVLMDDFYLPVWTDRITAEEYVSYERNWTDSELEMQKNSINHRKIEYLQKKGVQIIENDVKILDKCSHWEIRSRFVLEEPVGIRQNINLNEEIE